MYTRINTRDALQAGGAALAQDFAKMASMGTAERFEGTIKAPATFNAEADAAVIRKAMKGMGRNPIHSTAVL